MSDRTAVVKKPWYRRKRVIASGMVILLFAWLEFQEPGNAGPWHEAQTRTAWVEFNGRAFTVHNLRDFRYDMDQRVVNADYTERSFNLDNLYRGWFGLSHFGPNGLAHSFLSFEFRDGDKSRYLALSIEVRLRPDQSYKPLVGLFRRYTLMSIFSTEQDVIGLRSHVRGERVLLYPVNSSQEYLEAFFMAVVEDTNKLHQEPVFYNTVLDNCLTNLLKYSALKEHISFASLRALLPGRTDHLTYALNITPADLPFDEARQRATIDPSLSKIDDPEFSASLRCGWTGCP